MQTRKRVTEYPVSLQYAAECATSRFPFGKHIDLKLNAIAPL
jgi:hypothetical protein